MKVKIESGINGRETKIYLDGKEVTHAYDAKLHLNASSLNTFEISYYPSTVEFEGLAKVIAIIDGKKYQLIEGE